MGIGMQIVYFGFAGAAPIEAEAAIQLLRLERFAASISGCHLAIEAMNDAQGRRYDARLDLITRDNDLVPMPHFMNADPEAAVRAAFDCAERALTNSGGDAAQLLH